MIINLNKEDKRKLYKLLDTRDINISVASMFMEYNSYIDLISKKEMANAKDKNKLFLNKFLDFFEIDRKSKENRDIIEKSIIPSIKKLDPTIIQNDPYYKTVKINSIEDGEYFLGNIKYYPYQSLSYYDVEVLEDDYYREISKIGYFEEEVPFLTISKNDIIWMSITPNETWTILPAIERSFGKVITFGLGLGYYPFMCLLKDEVESVTIIEFDENIINLFKKHLLPFFPRKDKIKIIHADAFKYCKENNINEMYDFAYMDIWHGPEDGLPFYIHFKSFEEHSHCKIEYWLEDSIIGLARRCLLIIIEEILNAATDKNFKRKENDLDEVINDLYFFTKNIKINSYQDLHKLLSKESIIEMLEKLGKHKYCK